MHIGLFATLVLFGIATGYIPRMLARAECDRQLERSLREWSRQRRNTWPPNRHEQAPRAVKLAYLGLVVFVVVVMLGGSWPS
jgi:hypothetical protein